MTYPAWALQRPLNTPTLQGKVLTLRPVAAENAADIVHAAEVPDIARGFSLPQASVPGGGERYVTMLDRLRQAGIALPFMAYTPEGNVAGHMGITLRDIGHGKVTLGYWILPEYRGRGYASDGLRTMTEWLFAQGGVHRATLHIETWNAASAAVAESVGYVYEATLRNWEVIAGEPRDMMIYTRLG